MLFGESIRYTSYHTRRSHDLRVSLVPLEDSARPTPTANGESFSPPPPAAAATEAALTEAIATAATVPCCSLRGDAPLNVSLDWPVKMPRPIRVLMKHGNFDGPWPCDVPCEYMTLEPPGADVDVVVGEAAPPVVSAKIRKANPLVATAARSMESAIYYPSLRRLHTQVDASMTTDLQTSQVPVVYLTRSSIAKWNSVPVQWNASALLARFGSLSGFAEGQPSAVFVARNCHSKNGREDLIKRLAARLRGGVDRPGSCLNSIPWPRCAASAAAAAAAGHGKCGKHAVLRRYPFYLAFENSDDEDYVSEKVFHGLEAGVLPVYLGAPNVAEFVPPSSVVEVRQFGLCMVLSMHVLTTTPSLPTGSSIRARCREARAPSAGLTRRSGAIPELLRLEASGQSARGLPAQVRLRRHACQMPLVPLGVGTQAQICLGSTSANARAVRFMSRG